MSGWGICGVYIVCPAPGDEGRALHCWSLDRTRMTRAVSGPQVTFAAGLACEGLVPFCTIYSTFLQRGFDQVVHDVALQDLPGAPLPPASP